MTVTSVNHNPKNDSKYARRRSIWKGSHNQLAETVASLRGTERIRVYEYLGSPFEISAKFYNDWDVLLSATRDAPKRNQIMGSWDIAAPSPKISSAVILNLRSDLKLLWRDFILVTAQRIGFSSGAGADNVSRYNGQSLIIFAPGTSSFDIIVSKYGYGETNRLNHHFYQWQARDAAFHGLVNVDDYDDEVEGVTFYVAR